MIGWLIFGFIIGLLFLALIRGDLHRLWFVLWFIFDGNFFK